MSESNNKTIAIWILSIALIVVGILWYRAAHEPNSVKAFSEQLSQKQAKMKEACADTTTDDKKTDCINALEDVKTLLGDFFSIDLKNSVNTSTNSGSNAGNANGSGSNGTGGY